MYLSLKGYFNIVAPILTISSTLGSDSSSMSSVQFRTMYLEDPWTLPSLQVQLGGKTMSIKVEVVDAPLDYNILLGRNWIYNMQAVVSSFF